MILSTVSPDKTATTSVKCCEQRAEYLSILGAKNIIELCVGPSLQTLEKAYTKYGLKVTGNDIDSQWKEYYPEGKWITGDALKINCASFDTIVYAPPLSRGCTGKRQDALSIDSVFPEYVYAFKRLITFTPQILILVLPGRSFATKQDREQFYKLLQRTYSSEYDVELIPLKDKVVKYYDLVFVK